MRVVKGVRGEGGKSGCIMHLACQTDPGVCGDEVSVSCWSVTVESAGGK